MFDKWFKRYKYEDTRTYLRLPAGWPIKCESLDAGRILQVSTTKDVCAGGVAVILREGIPVGTRVRVQVHVPALNKVIQAEGQVVRCLPARGGYFELGIRFNRIDPKDREDLENAIEQMAPPEQQQVGPKKRWWRGAP